LIDLSSDTVLLLLLLLLLEVPTWDLGESLSQSRTKVGWRLLLPDEDEERESSTLKDERSIGKPLNRCLETEDRSVDVADRVNDMKEDSVGVSCHGGVC
jgi:hypothetical protein